ncbi:MAG: caspase family protein [Chitinophagaceae bacterium]|nr:MAG: caspase family protein [Chitinophagaceae bacterium]
MRAALLLLLLYAHCACAQDGKGINAPEKVAGVTGQTRALLIGVSRYQQVDSLRYADRDAAEFARLLQHNPGWKVPPGNVRLLTNEKAKAGDILTGIAWLEETSRPGDQVVFFFSGHGDVETKADSSKGFLLAHDSPRNNYITGAIPVTLLQKVFSKMIANGIRVFLVTDACRSGHLAGGAQGVQQTAQAFNSQWQNEIKYLSAQPNELSFEDSTWGGGRGVFSFFLMKGMNGYADLNQDSVVTEFELMQYVVPQVAQATKFRQQPIFLGSDQFTRKVAFRDRAEMERYARWGSDGGITVVVTGASAGKGHEYADTACPAYAALVHLLDTLRLDSAASLSALRQYEAASVCNSETRMQARLLVTAAFLNSIQQVVNQTLIGRELMNIEQQQTALHRLQLLLALNEEKALPNYDHLQNIRRYLTVNQVALLDGDERAAFFQKYPVQAMLDSALRVEPAAPYLLQARSIQYFYSSESNYDSVIYYGRKALEGSPTWMMPMLLIGMSYENREQLDSALYWYQKVETLDSAFRQYECAICFYTRLGELFLEQKQWAHAIRVFERTLSYQTDYNKGWEGLATAHYHAGNRARAAQYIALMDAQEADDLEDRLRTLQWLLDEKMLTRAQAEVRLKQIRGYLEERLRDSTLTDSGFRKAALMDSLQTPLMNFAEVWIAKAFNQPGWKNKMRDFFDEARGTALEFDATYAYIQVLWEDRNSPARLQDVYDLVTGMKTTFSDRLTFQQRQKLELLEATCLLLTDENDEIRMSFRKGTPLSEKQKEGIRLLQQLQRRRLQTCAEFLPTLRSLPDQKDPVLLEFYKVCTKK